MVSALRFITLCYLLVASMGLLLVSKVNSLAPVNALVVDCLSGDAQVPVWHIESRSSVIRPAIIDRSVRIDAISIIDGPAIQ